MRPLQDDFGRENYILVVIIDTAARLYVVEYSKEDLKDFEQRIASNEHFLQSARSNSEKPTCAVVP